MSKFDHDVILLHKHSFDGHSLRWQSLNPAIDIGQIEEAFVQSFFVLFFVWFAQFCYRMYKLTMVCIQMHAQAEMT